jgi:hypothetical protein
METKNRSEKIIFGGFIFLAISFIAVIIFFQYQNNLLNDKKKKLEEEQLTLKVQQAKLDAQRIELEKLKSLSCDSTKATLITEQTNEQIKNEINKIKIENEITSIIYIQVGSSQTKSNLIGQNFISSLNSKGYNVINAYDVVEKGVDNSIRFFNMDDKGLAEQLKSDIQKDFSISLELKFVERYKVGKGQIEIWIK